MSPHAADRLGMALVRDDGLGVWALGPEAIGGRALATAEAPELVLPDVDGNEFRLSSLAGSEGGPRLLGALLRLPHGPARVAGAAQRVARARFEFVTVGLEMGGAEVLRPFIEDARPEHPSLVDQTHRMDALFGVTNIPSGIWIDERGIIVRPHESAVPPPVMRPDKDGELQALGHGRPIRLRRQPVRRHGARLGPERRRQRVRALPDEVIARSHPQTREVSEAAAHFELAQHLWRLEGFSERALSHFAQAHTLQPDNITYKRQAYSQYRVAITDEPDDRTRFMQSPTADEPWPFVSDFTADMATLQAQRTRERRRGGSMILDALELTPAQLHRQTGWELKPEGACKEDRCVPVPGLDTAGGRVDSASLPPGSACPLHTTRHMTCGHWGPRAAGVCWPVPDFQSSRSPT